MTERVDAYAFGVVLYEMWTGSVLLPRQDLAQGLARVRRPEIDQMVFAELVEDLTRENPADRPSDSEVSARLALCRR